jgi:hypothetical protein
MIRKLEPHCVPEGMVMYQKVPTDANPMTFPEIGTPEEYEFAVEMDTLETQIANGEVKEGDVVTIGGYTYHIIKQMGAFWAWRKDANNH